MSILIHFEDKYGCSELFKHSNSVIKEQDVIIKNDLGNTGVFNISLNDLIYHDYILIVFDLDGVRSESLTSEDLRYNLNKKLLKDKYIKYINKVIFIPVFFSFETCYLYSDIVKDKIYKSDNSNRSNRLLSSIRKNYDYSIICPESMFNIRNNIVNVSDAILKIMSNNSKKKLTPQKLHFRISVEVLKLIYPKISINDPTDKIFKKSECELFDMITSTYSYEDLLYLIRSIIDGMNKEAVHNRTFCKLLNMQDINEIYDMVTIDKNLEELCRELDEYALSIRGVKRDICDIADKLSLAAFKLNSKIKGETHGI